METIEWYRDPISSDSRTQHRGSQSILVCAEASPEMSKNGRHVPELVAFPVARWQTLPPKIRAESPQLSVSQARRRTGWGLKFKDRVLLPPSRSPRVRGIPAPVFPLFRTVAVGQVGKPVAIDAASRSCGCSTHSCIVVAKRATAALAKRAYVPQCECPP